MPSAPMAHGKVALVTGAGSGIGRATAALFAAEGARMVVAADIDGPSASETARLIEASGGAAQSVTMDVAEPAAAREVVDGIVAAHGCLDAAVNCAGIRGLVAPVADYPADTWRQVMAVNLDGVFWCMQAEIGAMLTGDGGAIVNVASGAVTEPHAGLSAYGASKAAVVHLTQAVAVEYAGHNIRINAVLPGRTRTPMLEEYYRLTPGAESEALESAPMKRLGEPSETAETIVWLCSDRASYVAGAALLVDGAQHAGRL